MTREEMIELMARAMCVDNREDPESVNHRRVTTLEGVPMPLWNDYKMVAQAALVALEAQGQVVAGWQTVDTAPKDGTRIIGAFWADRYHKGEVVNCWWQPEFQAFISGCREMTLAPGYTFEDGSTCQLHSPQIEQISHWMPMPAPPKN